MTDPTPFSLPELLDFQAQVVSRSQVLGHGVSRNAVSRRARSGAWQRLQRGTYATFSGVPPREARLWAAVLRGGPGAVLSHETAAEVHGLLDKPSKIIHVKVPANLDPARYGKIPGVVIHRSRRVVSQELPPWQLPRTPVAETVLDLVAASKAFDDAYAWLSRATGRGLASAGTIKEALAERRRMRWREWLTVALAGGVRYLDNFYDAYRLCVELDGRSSHPPEQKWQDTDRDNENLFTDDVQTVRFGVRDVTVRRCARAAQLAGVLIRRGWDGGGLRPCGAGCEVTARYSPASGEAPRIFLSS